MNNFLQLSRRQIIILTVILLLIFSIPIGVVLVKRQQTLKSQAGGFSCESDKSEQPIEQYCLEDTLIKVFSYADNNECKLFYEPSTDPCSILVSPSPSPDASKYSISGFVFIDKNENGQMDNTEAGMADRNVILSDSNGTKEYANVKTNASGQYKFSDILNGPYRLSHEVPSGYDRTTDHSVPVTLKEDFVWNFGIKEEVTVALSSVTLNGKNLDVSGKDWTGLSLTAGLGGSYDVLVDVADSANNIRRMVIKFVYEQADLKTSFILLGPDKKPELGEEFSVKLLARSDTESANLFAVNINFPKDLMEVKEIKTEVSFIKNWVEDFYDNTKGEMFLSGGIPSPGYKTEAGKDSPLMATLIFKAKAAGRGTLSFADSSAIYSNNNNANILTTKNSLEMDIGSGPVPQPTATSKPSPSSTGTAAPNATSTPSSYKKGDANKDGKLDLVDMSILHSDWQASSNIKKNIRDGIDMNDDGLVNVFDFALLRQLLQNNKIIK